LFHQTMTCMKADMKDFPPIVEGRWSAQNCNYSAFLPKGT